MRHPILTKRLKINPFTSLTTLLLLGTSCILSSAAQAHGNDASDAHVQLDQLWAEQARKRNDPVYVPPKTIRPKIAASPNVVGSWDQVTPWFFTFASAANLPDGRIIAWGANTPNGFSGGDSTYASIWDPATNRLTSANNAGHSMFCGMPVMLEDGRIFVNGGDGDNNNTSTFDATTNQWSPHIAQMNSGRWYPGTLALPNNQVFTALGRPGGPYPELWTENKGWSYLTGANLQAPILNQPLENQGGMGSEMLPYFHLAPNGNIFHSGATLPMNWINPTGNGSIISANLNNKWDHRYGAAIMFDEGKILLAGGGINGYATAPVTNRAAIIDINTPNATITEVAPMSSNRTFHYGVMLPTGEAMMVGGTSYGQVFNDQGAVLAPEIWNPSTNTWRLMAPQTVPRTYHSVALLMPDGRVWSGGSGLCNCSADHPSHEVFSPPYLFNTDGTLATRPVISTAPKTALFGSTMSVNADVGIQKFSLIKMSATTHVLNSDLRYLSVPFSTTAPGQYQLSLHKNPNVLTPGYWMLFAVNAQGVPSVAKIIQVSSGILPIKIVQPSTQHTLLNTAVNLPIKAVSPTNSPLTYSATGLPPGVTINSATGVISGMANFSSIYQPIISVSDGQNTAKTSFVWNISLPGTVRYVKFEALSSVYGFPYAAVKEFSVFDNTNSPIGTTGWKITADSEETVGEDGRATNAIDGNPYNYWVSGWLNQTPPFPHWLVIDMGQGYAVTGFSYIPANYNTYIANYRIFTSIDGINWGQPVTQGTFTASPAEQFAVLPTPAPNIVLQKPTDQTNMVGNTVNLPISVTNASGLSLRYSAFNLPEGLGINPTTGVMSGTITKADNTKVTVVASNGKDISKVDFNWTVAQSSQQNSSIRYIKLEATSEIHGNPWVSAAEINILDANGQPLNRAQWNITADSQETAAENGKAANVLDGNVNSYWLSSWSQYTAPMPHALIIDMKQSNIISGFRYQSRQTNTNSMMAGYRLYVSADGINWGLPVAEGSLANTFQEQTVTFAPVSNYLLTPMVTSPQLVNTQINFVATPTNASNPKFKWLFGDNTPETAYVTTPNVAHTYTQAGVYLVTLTAIDDRGIPSSITFSQAVHNPLTANKPRSSSNMAYETRSNGNNRLWVVNQDNDTVSVFDVVSNQKITEIPVGKAPRSIAIASNGFMVVTNKQSDNLSVIDPTNLSITNTLSLPYGSQPSGVIYAPNTNTLYVTLEGSGKLYKMNGTLSTSNASIDVGANPRGLSLTADGNRVLVSRFITPPLTGEATAKPTVSSGGGQIVVVNTASFTIERTVNLGFSNAADTNQSARGLPNYLGATAIAPDGLSAWVPSKQDNIARGVLRDGNNLNFENTVRAISSRIDMTTGLEDLAARRDFDNSGVASAALYDRTGNYLFVALEATREVAVVDAYAKAERFRIPVGLAPQGLALSADGQSLYVNNFMDRTVGVYDLSQLNNFGKLSASLVTTYNAASTERLSDQVLQGKKLFYDAKDTRLARDGYLSCAACHNEGGQDGRVWDLTGFGEGLRNTINLKGRAGMGHGLLHWSGNFDEIQDFEGQIRSLAGGTGLLPDSQFLNGTRSQSLGDSKAGLSADLDALAAYVISLNRFELSPYRAADGSLTPDAVSGKALFASKGCTQCHSSIEQSFTNSAAGQLFNVGTLKPSSGMRLAGPLTGIDTPTLRDVWSTAPYLHDGSAKTLNDAIVAHKNINFYGAEVAQLAAYLQQIDRTEPQIKSSNLALGQPVTQSSTYPGGDAVHAVDGNTNGVWTNNSVSHTYADLNAWLQVDLGSNYDLSSLQLFNRTDCCVNRLSNFYVLVSRNDMSGKSLATLLGDNSVWRYQVPGQAPASLTIPSNANGRYVMIMLAGNNYLSLAELQVFGTKANLALGKNATQSSTAYNALAGRAVDGNISGIFTNNSVTHTIMETNPWWQVDLGSISSIGNVLLVNRTDCCTQRLSNFYVFVSSTDMTGKSLTTLLADASIWRYKFNGEAPPLLNLPTSASGRYVRVQLSGANYLSLAEIGVFKQ